MRLGVCICAASLLLLAVPAAASAADPGSTPLLATYQPVLYLYGSDWKPVTVETFLARAALERRAGARWQVAQARPSASSLPAGKRAYRLDIRGCTPAQGLPRCYRSPAASSPAPAVVYGRVWTNPDAAAEIRTVLEYWLFSYVNDWRNSLTDPNAWQIHEGDWEVVLVALGADGTPLRVAYSQHKRGVVAPWSSVTIADDTHPVVYVALGSHANYVAPGAHTIPPSFSGVDSEQPDFTAAEISYGPPGLANRPLRIVDVTSGAPWLRFAGRWGDGNYVLVRNGPRGTRFQSYAAGDSPVGPAFHVAWTNPLAPFTSWPLDDGH
jgi:hypothetical protein